jgi:hypothetical protein
MIKPEENISYWQEGNYAICNGIMCRCIKSIPGEMLHWQSLLDNSVHIINEPFRIEITSEILERCGFVKNGMYIKDGLIIGYSKDDFVFNRFTAVFVNQAYINIQYLHELQNLYNCLTGKELQVNL